MALKRYSVRGSIKNDKGEQPIGRTIVVAESEEEAIELLKKHFVEEQDRNLGKKYWDAKLSHKFWNFWLGTPTKKGVRK